MMDNIYTVHDVIWVSAMADIPYDLHIRNHSIPFSVYIRRAAPFR